ncbi:MAG: NAD(P)H-dependent oxidoreductase [Parachlamydiaceae bacterium]|nr:NAD(P)H-dependent oxidoreductase [Parachlamydiaceae bacterium]
MKILGIAGSLRQDSFSYKTLLVAMQKIKNPEIEQEIIQLRDLNLPFCDGSSDYDNHSDVALFRQKVRESKAILLAAPEYHGSVSGALKNALDLLEVEQVKGKVIGLIAVCGGVSNTGAINTLRIVCRWLHALVIPEQIVIAEAFTAFDERGQLRDPQLDAKLKEMVDHLVLFADRYPFSS